MDFNDVATEFFDSTVLTDYEDCDFKRSVVYGGSYMRNTYKYWYFTYILTERDDFLEAVCQKMHEDMESSLYEGTGYYFKCIELSLAYLQNHDMEDNIINFVIASDIVVCYWHRKNIFHMRHYWKPINIYDVFRYYLVFATVKKYELCVDDNFHIDQSKKETIEFGKIDLKVPIISKKMLSEEDIIKYIQETELSRFLNEKYMDCDIDIKTQYAIQKRRVYRGFSEKNLKGQELIDTYGNAFYCPKRHRANVTNLTLKSFLGCQKISKEKPYRVFDNGTECHVLDDKTDNEIFYFGYYFLTDEDMSVYKKVNISPIDANNCSQCRELMKFNPIILKGGQGYLECPKCKNKIDVLLIGYRTYNAEFGKSVLKRND